MFFNNSEENAVINEDVKVCNCANCGKELIVREKISDVAGRIKGRPYCSGCLEAHKPPAGFYGSLLDDTGPWQDIAIRRMEDGM